MRQENKFYLLFQFTLRKAVSMPVKEKTHPRRKPAINMTQGSIVRCLLLFSLPLLAGNIFQQFYNTVDSIVVGNFVGPDALGAVTANMPATMMLISLFIGFSSGASVVISQYYGAGREDLLRRTVHTSVVTTVILGIVLTLFGVWIAPWLVHFMNTPDRIAGQAVVYLRIFFSGLLGLMLYNMGSAILRAVGDSRRPLYFLIICSLTNVVLDLVFVINFRMGVAGVAYATILSQIISAVLVFAVLFRSRENYGCSMKEMRIDPEMLRKVVRLGLPAGIQMALTSFSNIFVMSYINSFGPGSTSGWGAYQRIDAFTVLPVMSIGIAITTFVGQNAGALQFERIRRGVRTAILMGLTVTVAISVLLYILAPQAIGLFNQDPDVMHFGVLFLRLLGPLDFLVCFNQCYAGTLRGVGDSKAPMLIMLFSFVFFRQIYLYIIAHTVNSVGLIALGYPAGWAVCSLIMFFYYRLSPWEERLRNEFGENEGEMLREK